jgi:WD40 repeat protein
MTSFHNNGKHVLKIIALAVAVCAAALLVRGPVAAQSPDANPAASDHYGDPLPDGAVARLGTVRLRHGMNAFAVAYSRDGKCLASAAGYGVGACIWDAKTGRALHKFSTPSFCLSVAFSPDSKTLCAASRHFDVATGKEIMRLQAPEGHSVVFSPDGKLVASTMGNQDEFISTTLPRDGRYAVSNGNSRTPSGPIG